MAWLDSLPRRWKKCYQNNAVAGSEGEKSISFNDIVAHLTKAVQELSARLELLETHLRERA